MGPREHDAERSGVRLGDVAAVLFIGRHDAGGAGKTLETGMVLAGPRTR
jgi:hypothetical protein